MALLPQTIEKLAQTGINLEISSKANLLPKTLQRIILATVNSGGHITISAGNYLPQTLQNFAKIGGKQLTIRL